MKLRWKGGKMGEQRGAFIVRRAEPRGPVGVFSQHVLQGRIGNRGDDTVCIRVPVTADVGNGLHLFSLRAETVSFLPRGIARGSGQHDYTRNRDRCQRVSGRNGQKNEV